MSGLVAKSKLSFENVKLEISGRNPRVRIKQMVKFINIESGGQLKSMITYGSFMVCIQMVCLGYQLRS